MATSASTRLFGVIGHPVAENPGKVIQEAAFGEMGLKRWQYLTIDVKPEDLEREIWAEIENIKTDGVTGDEIQKIKNRSEANFVRSLSFSAGLASAVGRAELHRGWRSILADNEAVQNVTNDDIKRVAVKYFVKDNSLTAVYTRTTGR